MLASARQRLLYFVVVSGVLTTVAFYYLVVRGRPALTWDLLHPAHASNTEDLGWPALVDDGSEHSETLTSWHEDGDALGDMQIVRPSEQFPEYSAAIIYLTSPRRAVEHLASLELLARHIPFTYNYPLIFFHDGGFEPGYQADFLHRWYQRAKALKQRGLLALASRMERMGTVMEFVYIDLTPPFEAMKIGMDELKPTFDWTWPGYHAMCHFFSTTIMNHHRIRNLDYYMRMDTDAFIETTLCYDPIRLSYTKNLTYTVREATVDPAWVAVGFWEFVHRYATSHELVMERLSQSDCAVPPPDQWDEHVVPTFSTNLEVVHIPSFQRPDVQDWLDTMDRNWRGFYQHRWGDAIVRRLTAAMFFPPESARVLCSFQYYHQATHEKSCECDVDLREMV